MTFRRIVFIVAIPAIVCLPVASFAVPNPIQALPADATEWLHNFESGQATNESRPSLALCLPTGFSNRAPSITVSFVSHIDCLSTTLMEHDGSKVSFNTLCEPDMIFKDVATGGFVFQAAWSRTYPSDVLGCQLASDCATDPSLIWNLESGTNEPDDYPVVSVNNSCLEMWSVAFEKFLNGSHEVFLAFSPWGSSAVSAASVFVLLDPNASRRHPTQSIKSSLPRGSLMAMEEFDLSSGGRGIRLIGSKLSRLLDVDNQINRFPDLAVDGVVMQTEEKGEHFLQYWEPEVAGVRPEAVTRIPGPSVIEFGVEIDQCEGFFRPRIDISGRFVLSLGKNCTGHDEWILLLTDRLKNRWYSIDSLVQNTPYRHGLPDWFTTSGRLPGYDIDSVLASPVSDHNNLYIVYEKFDVVNQWDVVATSILVDKL